MLRGVADTAMRRKALKNSTPNPSTKSDTPPDHLGLYRRKAASKAYVFSLGPEP